MLGRLAALLDLLYPPRCVADGCCGREAWLCPSCMARIRPVPGPHCRRCGLPRPAGACRACAKRAPDFDAAVAAGVYESPLREAVRALKYKRVTALAEPLGRLAASASSELAIDVVVPVPAHSRRVAGRGVDHALLLARVVALRRELPCTPEALRRTRSTLPQAGLGPEARRANVAGAFRADRSLAGQRVLLVDDVLTTGATASACAEALHSAGVPQVTVCTVARALGSAGQRVGPDL
jgi:ComF family protein